jgi:predicted DCC family thiol-disulfide oxidoreductase YuxK
LLADGGRDPAAEPALVLIDEAGLHAASDAALRIGRRLRAPWNLLARIASIVPRSMRERAYWTIAHSRKRLPG